MYLSINVTGDKHMEVKVDRATVYEDRGDGYKDHADETSKWLGIDIGTNMLRLRLTNEQLAALCDKIGAMIQDSDREIKRRAVAERHGFAYDPRADL